MDEAFLILRSISGAAANSQPGSGLISEVTSTSVFRFVADVVTSQIRKLLDLLKLSSIQTLNHSSGQCLISRLHLRELDVERCLRNGCGLLGVS